MSSLQLTSLKLQDDKRSAKLYFPSTRIMDIILRIEQADSGQNNLWIFILSACRSRNAEWRMQIIRSVRSPLFRVLDALPNLSLQFIFTHLEPTQLI